MSPDALPSVFAAAMAVWLLTGLVPGAGRRHSSTWIRNQGAPITQDLEAQVEDVRERQRNGTLLGALIGLIVAIPLSASIDHYADGGLVLSLAVWLVPVVRITLVVMCLFALVAITVAPRVPSSERRRAGLLAARHAYENA